MFRKLIQCYYLFNVKEGPSHMLDEMPKREPLLISERFRMSAGGVHSCLVRGRRELTQKTYFYTSTGTYSSCIGVVAA
jgi:hypothetical protein